MKVKDIDIKVRKVSIDDNFEEIAELIYRTDEFIYTYWFHDNLEECKKVMPSLMKEDGFFYNYKNMYIAIDKETNKIIGLICLVTPNTNFDYDYTKLKDTCPEYAWAINEYVMDLIKEVKELQLPYFSNVAVSENYEGKKVGTIMMQYVIEDNKKKYLKFLLDILHDNPGAIKMYKRVGFETTLEAQTGIGKGPEHTVLQDSMELNVFRRK